MPPDCVFCRIVAGQLPSCRVYEDDRILAFLDIAPLVEGHTLVIPKTHYDPFMDAPPEILTPLFLAVQRVARAMTAGLKADGVNLHQANGRAAGQVVPHLHVHVVPRFANDGHSWNWRPRAYPDQSRAQTLAAKIREALA
jgi:histidine triad (HIT) family protein